MTETTPLNSSAMMQSVNNMFTAKNMSVVSSVAQEKWIEVRNSMEDGQVSIRLMALFSATALIVSSTFGLLGTIVSFNISETIIEIYSIVLGVIMILLESKQLNLPQQYLDKLYHYALFLKYVWGRGILYLFAGSLHLLLQGSILDYIATKKLQELRKSLHSDAQIKHKFTAADTTKKGLTLDQFKTLTDQLGLDLNHREAEVIFLHLDKSADGLLTFQEFQGWWTDLEENYIF